MRIHHLDCGCMCPYGGALYEGFSLGIKAHLVYHCLLIETDMYALILVATGFGSDDIRMADSHISGFSRLMNNTQRNDDLTALSQVESVGYSVWDVRHIILTHLDFDHARGVSGFRAAKVHLMQQEINAVQTREGWLSRARYQPARWHGSADWVGYENRGGRWFGFDSVTALNGLPPEIFLIPLAGHTSGQAVIA